MIVIAFLIYLAKLVGGFLLIHLIWDSRELKALILKFFLGAGMGAGISSALYFLWSWLTLASAIYPFFELILLLVLIIMVWRKETKENLQTIRAQFSMPSKRTFFLMGLLLIAVLICIGNFSYLVRAAPHGFYDAWDIWNIGARFVYLSQHSWIGAVSQNAWDHADYPLLVTLNVADTWSMLGGDSPQVPVAFSLFFMLGLVGLLFSSLLISNDLEQGTLVAIVVLSLVELADIGFFQYADIQLAYFFLATVTFLYLYTVETDPRFLFLAGLFAGFSAWTKNEGGTFVIISLLACLLLSFKEKKNLMKFFIFGLIFPLITVLLFKSIAPPNDLFFDKAKSFQQLFDISRYQLILDQLWQKFTTFGSWKFSFLVILIVYALALWKPRAVKGQLWIPLGIFLFQFAGYLVIYLITPHDLYWHLTTSLDRLMFQVFPILIFWLFTLLPSPRSIFAEKLSQKSA